MLARDLGVGLGSEASVAVQVTVSSLRELYSFQMAKVTKYSITKANPRRTTVPKSAAILELGRKPAPL